MSWSVTVRLRPSALLLLLLLVQLGDCITLSGSDCCSPGSLPQRARTQVISSVGHLCGYPGFSGAARGLPSGSIEVSPLPPRRFWGRALPARTRR
jgi:hypothetical protein